MKRKITKVLATLLMLCMILPQTALAASDNGTYNLTVSISDSGAGATGKTVSDTTRYVAGTAKLVETIGTGINVEALKVFGSPAMNELLQAGLSARGNQTTWENFVGTTMAGASGSLMQYIQSIDTNISALTTGTNYSITYKNNDAGDAKYGVTYTITVRLTESYSGGGSSGGSSTSNTKTETVKNSDGSTTTTVTNKTTGTVTVTVKTADGTTGTVVTAKNGDITEVKATVSTTAAKEAAKTGEAVTLPVEVPAATSTEDAPAIKITVPKGVGSVKVEIPVEDVTPGTVAVIVNADGTEKIVSTSMVTEDGVVLTLDASATVKIIDNSKSFADVPETNVFYNEISSLSARGIMIGKSDDKFDLYSNVTLDQIANVAGRIIGAVDVSNFAGGVEWGKENGLETGNVPATRGNVLKALYIAAGSPAVEDTSILSRFSDASSISSDMAPIAAWAAQNGILKGNLDGTAGLGNNVTRGQACALAGRTMGVLA